MESRSPGTPPTPPTSRSTASARCRPPERRPSILPPRPTITWSRAAMAARPTQPLVSRSIRPWRLRPKPHRHVRRRRLPQNVQDVFFDYDSYDISSQNQSVVIKDAAYLNAHPNIKVVIGGYCDERGSTEYNLALGENRASAVKKALISGGVERRPHPHRQLRQREAVLHRARRKLLAAKPPRAVLDRPLGTEVKDADAQVSMLRPGLPQTQQASVGIN
jgi:outer membrane protein OmpA-like peptidoglycan-associated protein